MIITCVFDNINKLDCWYKGALKIPRRECHRHGIWGRKEAKRFGAFVVSGVPGKDASRCADKHWQFWHACAVAFPLAEQSR